MFICRVIFFIVIFVVFLANGIFQIFVQLYAACFNLTQIPSLLACATVWSFAADQ